MKTMEEELKINGWLAFFLWVGVGLGALITVIQEIGSLINGGYGPLLNVLIIASFTALATIAVMTIIAFYKRKPNAVSLAKTYISLIAFNGLFYLVIAIISEDTSLYSQIFRQFIWAGTWFSYIELSEKVRDIIPKEKRTWNMAEKVLASIYVSTISIMACALIYLYKSDNPVNILYSSKSFITQSVEAAQSELPVDCGNGVIMNEIKLDDGSLIYKYKIEGVYTTDFNEEELLESSIEMKNTIMETLIESYSPNCFEEICFNEGYNLKYIYVDELGNVIQTIDVTPSEYKRAISEGE